MSTGPRTARAYLARPSKILIGFLTSLVAVALSSVATRAQGTVPLKTVVTDQMQLSLSNSFGTPSATAIDQKGDFAFIGEGNSGLFMRASGATSVTRLLQNGDAVPNIAGSTITSFVPTIYESQAGVLFAVNYVLADGVPHQGIFVWSSGTTYTTIATDGQSAPGTTTTYGVNLQPIGINDSGDVAFSSAPPQAGTTLFITAAGGSAKRIVGNQDSVMVGTTNMVLTGLIVTPGLNARGQLLFYTTSSVYFVADKTGQITVVVDSALSPSSVGGGCTSNASGTGSVALNNAGVVAFVQNGAPGAICYATVGSPASVAVTGGANAPSGLTGTLSTSFDSQLAFDDSGDIVFEAEVGSTMALLRFSASNGQLSTVAYQGETEPSGTGATFSQFEAFSAATDGTATFFSPLSQANEIGLYQQSGTGTPVVVAMEGASGPTGVGGTIDLEHSAIAAQTLNNHSVFFSAPIAGGSAYFAEMLATPATPTTIQSLVSSADALPSGSRVQFSAKNPAAANYVGFAAQNSGGRSSLYVSNVSSATNTKIVTEGDAAPATGGVIALIQTLNSSSAESFPPPVPFYVNANGQAAFEATLAGSNATSGIFLGSPTASLTKVMASTDASQPSGTPFGNPYPLQKVTNPLNDNGQVAFVVQLFERTGPNDAIYRADPDGTIVEIVTTRDPGPNGGSFYVIDTNASPIAAMNGSGAVAFQSYASSGTNVPNGFYEGNGTSTPQAVAISGDKISGTTELFSPDALSSLSANGTLALTGETESELMVGTATEPDSGVTAIAVNGNAALRGGNFAFGVPNSSGLVFFPGLVQSNAENDFAFWAGLSGGNSTSGFFLSPGTGANAGVVQSLALQGESVSDAGTLNTISAPDTSGGGSSLGPDGRLIFAGTVAGGSNTPFGLFLAAPAGSLAKIVAAGDTASSGGTVTAVQMADGQAAGAPGTFVFWTAISGGGAHQAILVTQLPSGTNATTTTVTSSGGTVVQGTSVTLTAAVTSSMQGAPTGTIIFFDGGAALGPAVALSNGTATFSTSSLAIGSHSITAQYSGDNTFAASTSATFTQVITGPPDFSVTASPSSLTITAGQSGQTTITVMPINGSTQTVNFSCSGLPALATCTASPTSVTLDGTHAATATITIQTAATGNLPAPLRFRREPPLMVAPEFVPAMPSAVREVEIAFGLLALLYAARLIAKRRIGAVAVWTIVACGLLTAGCGGGGGSNGSSPGGGGSTGGTPSGNYSVTLTIAAGSDSHTATTSITVTR